MRYLDEIKPLGSTAAIELLGKYSSTPGEIIDDPYFVGFLRKFLFEIVKKVFFFTGSRD